MIFGRIATAEGKSTRTPNAKHLSTGLAGQSRYDALHICPECGTDVDRGSGYPYWVDRETRQRHHDPCPTDSERAEWGLLS